MDKGKHKAFRRQRRHKSIRGAVSGTPDRPRLAIYKSLKHIHAQVIDDLAGRTLVCASSVEDGVADNKGNCKSAASVGKLIADRAVKAGIKQVAFDRGGFRFHGRVKALADAAREGGLKF
ncbi:MAG: 50S ribosomal protein L18 [Phycisphaeraceae bacterium]|nr:50S ribosomal protein L18 [Phycisphaeraceae bacterium]